MQDAEGQTQESFALFVYPRGLPARILHSAFGPLGPRCSQGNTMRRRAFTLVEMVLVIVLTMILTSAAVGGLVGVQAWRGSSAVRRLTADLLHARHAAVLSARRTMCVFDSGGRSYELQQEPIPGSGPVSSAILKHPLTGQPWRVRLGDIASGLGVTMQPSMSPPEFGFGPDGRLSQRSGAVLRDDVILTFSNGAKVTVYAGSGLCAVQWP